VTLTDILNRTQILKKLFIFNTSVRCDSWFALTASKHKRNLFALISRIKLVSISKNRQPFSGSKFATYDCTVHRDLVRNHDQSRISGTHLFIVIIDIFECTFLVIWSIMFLDFDSLSIKLIFDRVYFPSFMFIFQTPIILVKLVSRSIVHRFVHYQSIQLNHYFVNIDFIVQFELKLPVIFKIDLQMYSLFLIVNILFYLLNQKQRSTIILSFKNVIVIIIFYKLHFEVSDN